MGNYASVAELRSSMNISDGADDLTLEASLAAAEQTVNGICGRTFTVPTAATTRRFWVRDIACVRFPSGNDIANTTGLVVAFDTNDDGTADSTWSASYYQLLPYDGVGDDGSTGWPYTEVRAVGSAAFVLSLTRPSLHVTARWGWPAVPAPVKTATLLLAAETWKLRDATFGVAGFGEFGSIAVRDNPKIGAMLAPYRRGVAVAGFA